MAHPSRARRNAGHPRTSDTSPSPSQRTATSQGALWGAAGAVALIALLLTLVLVTHARGTANGPTSPASAGSGFGALNLGGQPYHTIDGGATWSHDTLPTLPANAGFSQFALSPSARWVAWSQPGQATITVARTSDNGHTWQQTSLNVSGQGTGHPAGIRFTDAAHGWLVANTSQGHAATGVLFATSDGGATWVQRSLPFTGDLQFSSNTTGWLVGNLIDRLHDQLQVTQDAGQTWKAIPLARPSGADPAAPQTGTPIALGGSAAATAATYGHLLQLYTSRDGGLTFSPSQSFTLSDLDEFAQPLLAGAGHHGWLLAGHVLLTTSDGGATWQTLSTNSALAGAQILAFANPQDGWATVPGFNCPNGKSSCTSTTTLLHTADGGKTWSPATIHR